MADLESRVDKLEENQYRMKTDIDVWAARVDAFIQEMKDFKTEMRDRDNQRAAEIARTDAKIEQMREQHNADMKEITKEIRGMAITTILGVGAIVAAIMGFAWAVFTPDNSAPVQIQQPPAQTAQIQTVP